MAIMPQIATGNRKFRPDVKKSAQVQPSLQVHCAHQYVLMSPGSTGRTDMHRVLSRHRVG